MSETTNKIIDVTESFEEFIGGKGVAVVDFWATWCGPCKMLAPVLEGVAEQMPAARFGKVDIDKQPELCEKFRIYAVPNVCIFADGQLVDRVVGLSDESEYIDQINKYLAK